MWIGGFCASIEVRLELHAGQKLLVPLMVPSNSNVRNSYLNQGGLPVEATLSAAV